MNPPLAPMGNYTQVTFTRDGRAFDLGTGLAHTLGEIRNLGQERGARAAVAYDHVIECHMVFDLKYISIMSAHPYFVANRWWMSLSRPRAIAQALWFARDGLEEAA